MRNLKKILALVLALVMSLSLMATASAADFKDASDISENYQTAVNVLEGLKVFKGYAEDNTFRPKGEITRAEVATIIYRIATGDAEDKQASIYTNMTTSFTDLDKAEWARGYVNYCHNAQIIKGESATKFNPNGKITGYATLAMILRAMGYGKNGEFEGTQWEYNTASTAKQIGLIDNVIEAQLGANAPRELVAEILFRALLTEMVDYTVLNGYVKNGKTLGKENLGLEEVKGVITGNEFADLNSPQVLPEGKTQIQVAGEDNVRTLDYGTKITDIGESRVVYTQNTAKVLDIADSGKNTTKEYGEGVDISSPAKFRSVSEMNEAAETEYYTNFEPTGYNTSDWRIEYIIKLRFYSDDDAKSYATTNQGYMDIAGKVAKKDNAGNTFWEYDFNKVIKAGDPITQVDMTNIYNIFVESNGLNQYGTTDDNTTLWYYVGKVFVGTQTKKDISDEISYNQFVDTYINPIVTDKNWNKSGNGEWVKFIDNDGDGNAEYAFLTQYALTEAVSSYTNKAGDVIMQYSWDNSQNTNTDIRRQNFDDDDHTYQASDYTVRYMKDDEAIERDIAVDDIVLAAWIDNQYLVSKAESVTTSATNYNYKADEITAADGNTYGQSGIGNVTTLQNLIASMAPNTDYEMFLDKFGFVRAYRLPGETQYALVTELYFQNNAQGNLVQNWPMTVELVTPNEDGTVTKKEYNLVNRNTELVSRVAWTQITNLAQSGNYYNWLQPAIAHLGVTWTNMTPVFDTPDLGGSANLTYWANSLQLVRPINSLKTSTEFDYGKQNYIGRATNNYGNLVPTDHTTSFTNVAVVSIDGDNATINGAARVRLNQNGQASGKPDANDYAVDYIQLSTADVAKSAASYAVGGTDTYKASYNRIVNADKDTEIYVIYDGGVKYFKGYANMPALNADTVGSIHAAYAVARNTNTGTGSNNYWIADVLVYEVEKWDDLSETSISLAYYTVNQSVQSASSVTIDTLNNKTDPAKVQLVPSGMAWGSNNNWWDNWGYRNGYGWLTDNGTGNMRIGYGFYRLYNETAAVDGVMSAAAIEKITKDFNKAGIFAGTVTREVDVAKNGFIPVNMTNTFQDGRLKTEALISIADGKVYSITDGSITNGTSQRQYWEANDLWFNNTVYSNVKANDRIIWVGAGVKNTNVQSASFIVDLGSDTNKGTANENNLVDNTALWDATAPWLKNDTDKGNTENGLWKQIMKDQNAAPTGKITITIEHKTGVTGGSAGSDNDGTVIPNTTSSTITVDKDKAWSILDTDGALTVDGYTLSGLFIHTATQTNTAITPSGNAYGLTAAQTASDVTLYANYTATTYSLQVVGISGQTSTMNDTYVLDTGNTGHHTANTVLNDTGTGAATTGLQANSEATIVVTPAAGKTVTAAYTVNSGASQTLTGTANADGTITFKVKITGAVVVTVTEAAKTWSISASTTSDKITNIAITGTDVTSGGTYASGSITGTCSWATSGNVWVSVTPTVGYQVDPATVVVKADGVEVTKTAANWDVTGNVITLMDGGACDSKDVEITFNTKVAQYKVEGVTNSTPANAWDGTVSVGKSSDYNNQALKLTSTAQAYTVTAGTTDTLYVSITGEVDGVTPNVVVTGATANGPSKATNSNTWYYTLTNITGDVLITVDHT